MKRHIKGPCLTRSKPWTHASQYQRGTCANKLPSDITFGDLSVTYSKLLSAAPPQLVFFSAVDDPFEWPLPKIPVS
jgi:hypothetical protein